MHTLWLSSSSQDFAFSPFPTFFLLGAHVSLQGPPVLGLMLSLWVTAFLFLIWWFYWCLVGSWSKYSSP